MSLLKTLNTQIGISNTQTNNFTIRTENSEFKISRGNADTPITNIINVDANDQVQFLTTLETQGAINIPTAALDSNDDTAANVEFVLNSTISSVVNYYSDPVVFNIVGTIGGTGSALVKDSSGNLYWAVTNYYNGSNYNQMSYIYKITPDGIRTQFASQATSGGHDTSLVFDSNGNLYWAIVNNYNGTTYSLTSYVYKITPGGTLTTFASQATTGARCASLVFDSSGNLYWAIANQYTGTGYSTTSYVYKITSGGTKTQFASQATSGAVGTSLAFDSSENLYWALTNNYNGTTNELTSYVYKITSGGTKTTFASQATSGGHGTHLVFDPTGDLYWALTQASTGATTDLLSYIFKITPEGTKTTFAQQGTTGCVNTHLLYDSDGNWFWALSNHRYSTNLAQHSHVYMIPSGGSSVFRLASSMSYGGYGTPLLLDDDGSIYWALCNRSTPYPSTTYTINSYLYKLNKLSTST